MKIVILVRILWTAGAPKKAIREAKALSSLGHECEVIFLRKSDRIAGYSDLMEGVRVEVIADHNDSPLVPAFDFLTGLIMPDRVGDGRVDYNLIRSFPNHVSANPPELLICHDQYAGLAGFYSKKRLGVRYSVLMHERVDWLTASPLHGVIDHFERRTLKGAQAVIASTEKIAETVRSKHKLNVVTNYQGLDLCGFTPYDAKQDQLLAVSTWDVGRKPSIYLDIMDSLPRHRLVMAGNWRSESELRRFRGELATRPCRNRVAIAAGIDEATLNKLYDSSKFTLRFGFGEFGESHAVFESLQRGVPPIINKDLGTEQLVKANRVGACLDSVNAEGVASEIERLDAPQEYAAIQERIKSLAKVLTWERHAKTLLTNA